MVNVSRKLQKDVLLRISKQFNVAILNLKNTATGIQYLHELLSETEQLMLAKRLAVILMLEKNIPWSQIEKTLAISQTTIARIQRHRKAGGFSTITVMLQEKKNRDVFWLELEILLRAGMPPLGKNRWQSIRTDVQEYKKKH